MKMNISPQGLLKTRCHLKSLEGRQAPQASSAFRTPTAGSSVHGISQARILEWVTIVFLRVCDMLGGEGRQEKGGEWVAGWDGTDGAGLGRRAGEGARKRRGG